MSLAPKASFFFFNIYIIISPIVKMSPSVTRLIFFFPFKTLMLLYMQVRMKR